MLSEFQDQYQEKGLKVLLFPCNQFLRTEPWSNEQIKKWVEKNYSKKFNIFSKTDVNGQNTCEVYKWQRLNSELRVNEGEAYKLTLPYGKFLINNEGKVLQFYKSFEKKEKIEKGLLEALVYKNILI